METAIIIFKQMFIMALYMGIGYFLYKKRLVTQEGSRCLANLLIYIILPSTILLSFSAEIGKRSLGELAASILLGLIVLLIAIALAALFFKKRSVDNFGAAFSNAGFMGIPLVSAIAGQEAVFYVSGMVGLLNIFQWYYGQSLLAGRRVETNGRELLKNPLLICLVAGVLLFVGGIKIPDLLESPLRSLQGLNAPVAMIVLGVYLAQADIKELFVKRQLYEVSAIRLLLIPLATLVILGMFSGISSQIRLSLLIVASAPVGSNVAVYAQKLGKDYTYAVQTVCLSTIFSIITMPLFIIAAQMLWNG